MRGNYGELQGTSAYNQLPGLAQDEKNKLQAITATFWGKKDEKKKDVRYLYKKTNKTIKI